MKKFFPQLSIKSICTLGLLLAITILLGVFGTFRVGDVVKIPTKFISVFVAAATFGPVWGGVCGAVGDLLNAIIAPAGPLLPQITLIEFLSGFTYGLFFIKGVYTKNKFVITAIICVLVQMLIDMVLTTAVLTFCVGYYPSFAVAFAVRAFPGLIKAGLQLVFILPCKGLIERIKREAYGK